MRWCVLVLLVFTLPAAASDEAVPPETRDAIAELKDTGRRAAAELEARIGDLQRMVDTIERLSREQDEYIDMLRRRLDALRDEPQGQQAADSDTSRATSGTGSRDSGDVGS